MKITAIGHASYLIETAAGTILTDPVFFDPFEAAANRSYPDRTVNLNELPKVNCVVISHRHFDHFDIRTLAALDRDVMVLYPEGEPLIEMALVELGYQRRRALKPWAKARAGALEIVATPSQVSWPELGLVVSDGVTTIWSLIDTVVDREIVKTLREHVPTIDCLLAPYSPILQYELRDAHAARHLDAAEYGWLLDIVRLTEPQFVVPSAGGLRYGSAEWQNGLGFPVTPTRYLADLNRAVPGLQCELLEPGDMLHRDKTGWRRAAQAAVFVSTAQVFDQYRQWHHDPATGVPAFTDTNPLGAEPQAALDAAIGYVTDQLVADLLHPANSTAFDVWREWHVTWRLDLYPIAGAAGNTPISWRLDFANDHLRLEAADHRETDIRTVVAASGIYDLLAGRCSPYAFLFADRTRHTARVFDVTTEAVRVPDSSLPEPLLTALTGPRDLDDTFVRSELRRWSETTGDRG